nr:MAG TPA: restriction alleviation protein [Caudoviricetes sp.]
MNYRGQKHLQPLPPCQHCGMDSGVRKQTEEPDRYCVICESCGWHTAMSTEKAKATRDWKNGKLFPGRK